jgi:hypothetical protein
LKYIQLNREIADGNPAILSDFDDFFVISFLQVMPL